MTPDELITRLHRQRADIGALQLALSAFMVALPAELQDKVLQALRTLQSVERATLLEHGADAMAVRVVTDASARLYGQLDESRKALVPKE